MIPRAIFDGVGGFDEDYRLNFSDVALCLAIIEQGYRVVYTPHTRLLHHESLTHRRRGPRADIMRGNKRLAPYFETGDPYFNPNLSYEAQIPIFNKGTHDTPQQLNIENIQSLPDTEYVVT
jgi:GT2 family glycosyltransferase